MNNNSENSHHVVRMSGQIFYLELGDCQVLDQNHVKNSADLFFWHFLCGMKCREFVILPTEGSGWLECTNNSSMCIVLVWIKMRTSLILTVTFRLLTLVSISKWSFTLKYVLFNLHVNVAWNLLVLSRKIGKRHNACWLLLSIPRFYVYAGLANQINEVIWGHESVPTLLWQILASLISTLRACWNIVSIGSCYLIKRFRLGLFVAISEIFQR